MQHQQIRWNCTGKTGGSQSPNSGLTKRSICRKHPVIPTPAKYPLSRCAVFTLLAGAGLWWDLYSKSLAFSALGYARLPGDRQPISEPWFTWLWGDRVLFISTNFNYGALWGIGQGWSTAFALLSILAALGIAYWLFVHGAAHSLWLTVALGFVMAGTLGNLYDRLGLHGLRHFDGTPIRAVRDFIYFKIIEWPIFNFADSFLVTGAIMLVLHAFWIDTAEKKSGELSDRREVRQTPPS